MRPNAPFTLPANDQHSYVVGQNGSGKSQFGAWLLSTTDLANSITFVIDYKGEELFESLDRAREIGFNEMPDKPGLYILRSRPDLDDETDGFLWRLWERGHARLFVDEAYMLPQGDKGPFQAILTQGRSKRIPVITLSQRPVKVSRFVLSESKHIVAFDLSDRRDRKTLEEVVPEDLFEWLPPEYGDELPPFHARWYSVNTKSRYIMKPVPSADEIRDAIDAQLEPRHRWF